MPGKIPTISEAGITIDSHRSWIGYAALQHVLKCEAPLRELCAVSAGHVRGSVRLDKVASTISATVPIVTLPGTSFLLSNMRLSIFLS